MIVWPVLAGTLAVISASPRPGANVPATIAPSPVVNAACGTWASLTTSGFPPDGRSGHSAVYDPVRRRMIVFGGSGSAGTWALSLTDPPTWTALGAAGALPPSLGACAVYDPVRDRVIAFGGGTSVSSNIDCLPEKVTSYPLSRAEGTSHDS